VTAGPGRFDTFGPEKALLNWPFEALPPSSAFKFGSDATLVQLRLFCAD
jgi:hypothetical protein